MYVSKQDIDTLSELRAMVQNIIESGPDDEDYWFGLERRTDYLIDKAIKNHCIKKFNRNKK